MMFSTKLVATFATLAAFAASAVANPDGVSLQGRAELGEMVKPKAGTVWKVGTTMPVWWFLDHLAPNRYDGKLYLNYAGEGPSGDHHTGNAPIASGFDVMTGKLDIPVPNVKPGDQYTITLYTGDEQLTAPSAEFTITQV